MSNTYDTIVDTVAHQLEQRLRTASSHERIYVVAYPTTSSENGRVEIISENQPSAAFPARIVPPTDRIAGSWNHVPYSGLRSILWQALRSEAILPIHPIAA